MVCNLYTTHSPTNFSVFNHSKVGLFFIEIRELNIETSVYLEWNIGVVALNVPFVIRLKI